MYIIKTLIISTNSKNKKKFTAWKIEEKKKFEMNKI